MNLLPGAKIKCPLSVLQRIRIIEVFLKKIYENFVGTLETVRNREVSVPRGSTVNKWDSYSTAILTFHFGQNHQFRKTARLDFISFKKTTFLVQNKQKWTTGQTQMLKRCKNCIENIQIKDKIKLKYNSNNKSSPTTYVIDGAHFPQEYAHYLQGWQLTTRNKEEKW